MAGMPRTQKFNLPMGKLEGGRKKIKRSRGGFTDKQKLMEAPEKKVEETKPELKNPIWKTNSNAPLPKGYFNPANNSGDSRAQNAKTNMFEQAARDRIGKHFDSIGMKFESPEHRQNMIIKARSHELSALNEERTIRGLPEAAMNTSRKLRLEQIGIQNKNTFGSEIHPELTGQTEYSGIHPRAIQQLAVSNPSHNPTAPRPIRAPQRRVQGPPPSRAPQKFDARSRAQTKRI
jgi:hypothetical protein